MPVDRLTHVCDKCERNREGLPELPVEHVDGRGPGWKCDECGWWNWIVYDPADRLTPEQERTVRAARLEEVAAKIRAQAHSELAQVAQLGHVAVPTDDAYWLLDLARDGIKFPAERRRAIDAESRLIEQVRHV